ncbi:hypothetical protein UlMin_042399 [Ulmus minor]
MGRAPCCDKANVKKGPWSPEEDAKLKEYIDKYGTGGNWIALPQKVGLRRCGKSCRLRWLNYLRPNIRHGEFSEEEDRIICTLFANIGSRWSIIAAQLPGRTDNDIKNYWNTKLKKKLMGLIPPSQRKLHPQATSFSSLLQATSSSSSPSSYGGSHNSTNYTQACSFSTGSFEPFSAFSPSLISSCSSTSTNSASILQVPLESFGVQMQQNYQVNKDSSFLMFGGEGSTCSSSDGSCNNHKEFENSHYFQNGVGQQNQKLFVSNGWNQNQNQKQNGNGINGAIWNDSQLDYGMEEIKQLISTNSCSNFLFDENKTDERVLYHY